MLPMQGARIGFLIWELGSHMQHNIAKEYFFKKNLLGEIIGNTFSDINPTNIFLGQGWRSLIGYNPWGSKESDTTERLHFHFQSPKAI